MRQLRTHRLLALILPWLLAGCIGARRVEIGSGGPTGDVAWRVATYNTHHVAGMDGKIDLERFARVLERTGADVIALQEMDVNVTRSGKVDQPARLAQLLGMQHAFGSFMDYQGGQYGLAVLSRFPIVKSDVVRLPTGNEPRVAVAARIRQPNGAEVTFVSVHFDWVGSDSFRYAQAERLAAYLDSLPGPYIVAGDFNDDPESRTIALFDARAREARKPRERHFTFSSTKPEKEIDFIFASPPDAWRADSVRVLEEPVASDHLPVAAVLYYRRR